MTPTTLAAAILRDVPRIQAFGGNVLSEDYVLATLTAAMDPALTERAGEVLSRLRKADEYEPLGHDGWEAADLITALLTANAALRAERDKWMERCGRERAFASSHRIRAEAAEAQIATLTARVERLTGVLEAMLNRHVLYCGGPGLPYAGHTDSKLFDLARAALSAATEQGHE